MKRQILCLAALAALLTLPSTAQASFALDNPEAQITEADGSPATQAGSHPFALTDSFELGYSGEGPQAFPEGRLKDALLTQMPGLVGDTTAYPRCSTADFLNVNGGVSHCPNDTAIGVTASALTEPGSWIGSPVYNLVPPPGALVRLGFHVIALAVTVDVGLEHSPPYAPLAAARNIPQPLNVFANKTQLWGDPSDPAHATLRGSCYFQANVLASEASEFEFEDENGGSCPVARNPKPFLTLPTRCAGANPTTFALDSYEAPGSYLPDGFPDLADPAWASEAFQSPPFSGCEKLGLAAQITARPTSKAATSPTGLDFSLDVADEGLANPEGLAASDIKAAEVTLPKGISINPSQAEGLAVCSPADLARESLQSEPGEGCPQASKVGTIEVETPLLQGQLLKGSLFVAKPYENPFGSLIALYIVIRSPELGIFVIQAAKVTPDPATGQLITTTEEMPQLPFSHFRLHFREGARSPLVSPPACGAYDGHDAAHEPVRAVLTPWAGGPDVESTSTFQIVSGPDSSPCPTGGLPPFHPHLEAGTLNNAAGRFSPFNVKLTRSDSEQELTHFSIKLPPGIAGKLAGIPFCSDAAIAAATARTGPHGGQEELDSPSCPAASQVGRTLAGAGVGPSLAYAPGKVYLAGPYHGAPVSLVAITAGVVGPFDIGTVVVRLAIDVNPETGEVFLDSTGSDPIPHIIKGIPVHLRDIRAYTDRPEFTFNPTSCERTSTASTVLGSGLNFASEADDAPFTATSPFQAADCAALPFAPKLSLSLIGGTKRGQFPKLRAFLRMHGFGEAGVARAQVTLPRSEFIANAHFKTICTRVQFKEAGGNGEACPPGSIYGWAKAKTPILAEALEGPVFLRSSEHQLPDVVASLRGQEINVHLVGHVDSVKGRLRNTFETVPDAPVEWASFTFQGQKKGLFENSTDLCAAKHSADVKFSGHNGKHDDYETAMKVRCAKGGRKHRGH
jgi:hypothetical protein